MADGTAPPAYVMEALATLPVFFKLSGKVAIVAGGGPPAVWKAALLAAAGSRVTVLAETPCPEMIDLAQQLGDTISLLGRRWTPGDLEGAALAVGAIEDDDEAAAFRSAARAAGVPVNVVDKPAFCDFQFGTVVSRSPLLIGISTEGAAPVFGQAIRTRIEALLPQSLRAWAIAARAWRPAVQARRFDFAARRRFWAAFSQLALTSHSAPTDEDEAACFRAATGEAVPRGGLVALVGSGSGRPEDLTLAAVAALQNADVIVYDADVDMAAVGLGRREAHTVAVIDEAQARHRVGALAIAGRRVAWIGTGNPLLCRKWIDRRDALTHVRLERVPGLAPSDPDTGREPSPTTAGQSPIS